MKEKSDLGHCYLNTHTHTHSDMVRSLGNRKWNQDILGTQEIDPEGRLGRTNQIFALINLLRGPQSSVIITTMMMMSMEGLG